MLINEQSFAVLLVGTALLVLAVVILYNHSTAVKEGLDTQAPGSTSTPSCPTNANVLPFKNAGNVASLQTQMTTLQNSTTKALSEYDTLETTTQSLATRLTKAEEQLEALQASIKQNAKLQNDKVKAAQDKLNKLNIKT